MSMIASQITSLAIVYSIVYSDVDQRKHQSSASLAFVRGIHRRPVNSPRKWPVTRKMFPFDDVIMVYKCQGWIYDAYICEKDNESYFSRRFDASLVQVELDINASLSLAQSLKSIHSWQ